MGFAATLGYVFLMFVRPQELYPELSPYSVMSWAGWVAILCTAVSLLIGTRPRPNWLLLAATAGFLIWSALSVALAVRWLGGAAERLFELATQLVAFFLLALNVSSRRQLAVAIGVVCGSVLLVLGLSARGYYLDPDGSPFFIKTAARGDLDTTTIEDTEVAEQEAPAEGESADDQPATAEALFVKRMRALGFLSDPNDLAQAFVAAIPLFAAAWRRRRWAANGALVAAPIAALVWGILLTRSRGGLLALAAILPLTLMLSLPPRRRRAWMLGLGAASIPGIVALFRYALKDESALGRIEAWSAGLQMLKSSPVWGVGSGFFIDNHPLVAHNSFVQCFAETGLVGYTLWLSLLFVSLGLLSSIADGDAGLEWRRLAGVVRLSTLGFLVGAMFLSRTTSPLLFLLVGLAAATASAARVEGLPVSLKSTWALQMAGFEVASILTVWLTSRAAW